MSAMKILTITQLNCFVKSVIDSENLLNNIFIVGEISNFKSHYPSGHMYFSLKDDKCAIKAVMFSWSGKNLKFLPQDGMKVIVRGRVSLYEATGTYQIYAEDMQPDGLGALNLAYEQLKNRLEKEGLFDISHKKSIPKFPKKIGVITAKTGAVFHDIQSVLQRRFPLAEILFHPVLVQGAEAPAQIAQAIRNMNNFFDADVLIVGRGGGSIEDLWAFNSEDVARAVYNSKIPIISAVGHETDFTICDFVADLRAPTPSAAAELATQDSKKIFVELDQKLSYMHELMKRKLAYCTNRLTALEKSETIYRPKTLISKKSLQIDLLKNKLLFNFSNIINKNKNMFCELTAKLEVLSPLKLLSAGYSIVTFNKKIVKSVANVTNSDLITVQLMDGQLVCQIEDIKTS